jgi:outer membrane protein TolC
VSRWPVLLISLLLTVQGFAEPLCISICEAEQLALQNNKQLNAVRMGVVEGIWNYRAFMSGWLPQVVWTAYAARTQNSFLLTALTGAEGQRSFYANGFTINQVLFAPKLIFGSPVQHMEVEQQKLSYLGAVNDIILAVRAAYYLVLVDELELLAHRENISLLTQSMQEEERRYRVGDATLFQLNETKVAVTNALPPYYQALKELKNDRDQLVELLGLDPDCADCLTLSEREIPLLTVPFLSSKLCCHTSRPICCASAPDELFDLLLQGEIPTEEWVAQQNCGLFSLEEIYCWEDLAICYRPDVLLARKQVITEMAKVRYANGLRLPNVDGSFQWNKPGMGRLAHGTPSDMPFGGKYSWGGYVDIQWELFSGFRKMRNIRAAQSAKCAAQFNYQKSTQDAKVAVRANFYQMEEAFNSYFAAHQGVLLAEQAIQQAQHQLRAGVITTLQYRDVVEDLLDARTVENYARYSLLISYYALLHTAGMETRCCIEGCW